MVVVRQSVRMQSSVPNLMFIDLSHHVLPNNEKANNLQNPAVPFIIPVDFCFIPTSKTKVVNVAPCKMSLPIITVTRYLRIFSIHCNRKANLIWNLFDFQSRCNAAKCKLVCSVGLLFTEYTNSASQGHSCIFPCAHSNGLLFARAVLM